MLRKKYKPGDIWFSRDFSVALKRFKALPSSEILLWADQAGTGMCLAIEDFRRKKDKDSLEELRRAVSILQAAVEELLTR